MSDSKKEFLTFKLAKEEFGIEINRVQEIKGWVEPSPLPNVPSFVKGVIDLRGTVVSVLDLRERFKIPSTYGATTVIIVVNVMTKSGEKTVGLVVDAVSDVRIFDTNELQPAPDISKSIDGQYILGLGTVFEDNDAGKKTGKMVILVDLDLLVAEGLLEQISEHSDDAMPTGNG